LPSGAKREGKRKLKLYLFDASTGKSAMSRERERLMGNPEAVVLLDEHARIQMLNVPAERFLGYTAGELIHKHVQKLFPNAPYADSINYLEGLTTEQHPIALGS
jgi:PAS domain S-box-containing protein